MILIAIEKIEAKAIQVFIKKYLNQSYIQIAFQLNLKRKLIQIKNIKISLN